MKKFIVALVSLLILTASATRPVLAGDQEDAAAAARQILGLLQKGQYDSLWTSYVSEFFKARTTKDAFVANLSLGRAQLGQSGSSKFVDMAYSKLDPGTGFQGEIYAINFLNRYTVGDFFERIVVVKEADGKFRLSGLWGAPAPKQ